MGNAIARTETIDIATAGIDEDTEVQVIDVSTIATMSKAEIDQQVATAHRYPRSVTRFREDLLTMATIDQETADACIYALPRGGKTIEGPSVRFAEMVANAWGNIRWGGRVIEANDRFVVAQGFAHDLQTNNAIAIEVRRRVVAKKGRKPDEDMIQLACAAATSIARRNALLAVVPRALTKEAYDAADNCATTGQGSFEDLRSRAIGAFIKLGATQEQVFAALGVEGLADVNGQHIRRLRRMLTAIKGGELTLRDAMRSAAEIEAENRGRATVTTSTLGPSPKTTDEDPTAKDAP